LAEISGCVCVSLWPLQEGPAVLDMAGELRTYFVLFLAAANVREYSGVSARVGSGTYHHATCQSFVDTSCVLPLAWASATLTPRAV
jgi:hypothetical protein